jgi:hypothetical protein
MNNMKPAETLHEALDSLAFGSLPSIPGRRQLTFVGVPFGPPVDSATAWALIFLLRSGHPATEQTLNRAVDLAAESAMR